MFPHSPGFLTSQTALFFQFAFLGGSRSLLWLHGIRQAVKKCNTSGEVPESGFQRMPASGRLKGLPAGWDNILDMVCAEWGLLWIKWQVWLPVWLQKCRLTHLYKVQPKHRLSYRASYFSFKHVFPPDQQKFSQKGTQAADLPSHSQQSKHLCLWTAWKYSTPESSCILYLITAHQ